MNKLLRHLAAATALSLVPALASAATLSLTYNGGTAGGGATITAAPVTLAGGNSTGAYGFNMTDTSGPLGNFIAWCLDLEHFLASGPYVITTTPFSNSYGLSPTEIGRVQSVFDANYAGLNTGDNTQAAGFQVALWNAIYDTDWDAVTGTFSVAADAVAAQANTFLTAASGFGGPQAYRLTFLESTSVNTSQNLVTAAPVPLPAAAFLLVGALGGLAALRRRKQA